MAEITLDQTVNVESSEKPFYAVISSSFENQFAADAGEEELTLGYVLLDENLKCTELGFEKITGKELYTERITNILNQVQYIVGFRIDEVIGIFLDLEIENNNTDVIDLMQTGANYVGIPHPTKKQYKWPKLIELTSKLFLTNSNDTLLYNKYPEYVAKLDTKIFIRMMELDLIDFKDLNNTKM